MLKQTYRGREPGLVIMGDNLCLRGCGGILAPYTGWTCHFFTLICFKNCMVYLKRPKIKEKEAGVGPFKKLTAKESIW